MTTNNLNICRFYGEICPLDAEKCQSPHCKVEVEGGVTYTVGELSALPFAFGSQKPKPDPDIESLVFALMRLHGGSVRIRKEFLLRPTGYEYVTIDVFPDEIVLRLCDESSYAKTFHQAAAQLKEWLE